MTTALAGSLASRLHRRPGLGKCAKRGGSKSLPPESLSNQISTEQVVHFEAEEQVFDNISTDDEFLDVDDFDDYDFEDDDNLKLAMEGKVVEWYLRGPGGTKKLYPWRMVSLSLDGNIQIYAFSTTSISIIQVRIENLSNKYGSPTMADIEEFSSAYRTLLDEVEQMGKVPDDISLEVSSPGLERVVRVPEDLERFKDLPLYVKYVAQVGSEKESDGMI